MKTNKLQRKIMRRVYYTYAMRLMTHSLTLQVVLFGLALGVFAHMVHVKRIIDTLLQIPVGRVPHYVLNAFMNGEVLTLLSIAAMVFVALSFPWQVRQLFWPRVARAAV